MNFRRETDSEFRLIADSAPVPIWVTKLDRKRGFVNRAYVDFLGVSYAEAVDFDWRTILHPDDVQRITEESIAGEASLATFSLEARYRRHDGEWRWIHSVSQPRWDADGHHIGFIGVAHDITEAKFAEQELREREAQLSAFVNQATAGFGQVDLDGRFTLVNDRFCEIAGRSREELLGMTMQQITHPDDLPNNVLMFDAAVRDGAPYTHEKRYVRPDGSIVWVNNSVAVIRRADGNPYGVLAITLDVTERRMAQEAARRSEERLAALNRDLEREVAAKTAERDRMWRLSRDLQLVIGKRHDIRAANPALGALGYQVSDVLGRRFGEFLHPEDRATARAMIASALRASSGEFSCRISSAGGDWRTYSWTLAPGEDEAYAIGRDVTVEVERRRELELAQEALRQSQKVEALGQLTGGVAHDFNNLLTPIIGSLDLVRRDAGLGSRTQRLIGGAIEAADRARTLVQRLLAFARRQPLQAGPVDLGALAGGMADLIASTLGPQIRLVVDIPQRLPPVHADANQLEMAILNLCVNSRDAMPEGGVLTIAAHHDDERPEYATLSISDSGEGMDEDTLARAIEPFFSTKGVGRGTGLGLSMVHGLASQLGGDMAIASSPGQGTTVRLVLPYADRTVPAAVVGKTSARGGGAGGTVLLVDDERAVRVATAEMLAHLGFDVVQVSSAEEAIDMLGSLRPDYLVTDHLMPGMAGTDLARIAIDMQRSLNVLIISGYANLEGIPRDLRRLAKPFTVTELATAMSAFSKPPPG